MGYTVRQTFGKHEGGTKFYQIISISRSGVGRRREFVVTHWGKLQDGAVYVPAAHGQSKVEKLEGRPAHEMLREIGNNKRKRGYNFNAVGMNGKACTTMSEITSMMSGTLKPAQLNELHSFFVGEEDEGEVEPVAVDPSALFRPGGTDAKPKAPEPTTPRHNTSTGWGTW